MSISQIAVSGYGTGILGTINFGEPMLTNHIHRIYIYIYIYIYIPDLASNNLQRLI